MKNGYLRLMQAVDPLFPIGSFTLSNGMETYVQQNSVYNKETLSEFLNSYLYLLPYNELGFAAKAFYGENPIMLDNLCSVSKVPYEIREGSRKLCSRFIKLEIEQINSPKLTEYSEHIKNGECEGHHCIAMGLFINDTGTNINLGLEMYCYSLLSAMVNHAVKLVPLKQLDGQQCLSEIIDMIPSAVQKAIKADIDELGISGAGFDLRSMQHEKLYSRLYIS